MVPESNQALRELSRRWLSCGGTGWKTAGWKIAGSKITGSKITGSKITSSKITEARKSPVRKSPRLENHHVHVAQRLHGFFDERLDLGPVEAAQPAAQGRDGETADLLLLDRQD